MPGFRRPRLITAVLALLTTLAVGSATAPAAAEEIGVAPSSLSEVEQGRPAIGGIADSKSTSTGLATAGLVSYAFTPSVIHAAHGHGGKAIGDAALRIFTPVVGALVGALVGGLVFSATYKPPPAAPQTAATLSDATAQVAADTITPVAQELGAIFVGGEIGFLTGVVTASVIDAALLAREPAGPPASVRSSAAAAERPAPVSVRPVLAPNTSGLGAGLAGTF